MDKRPLGRVKSFSPQQFARWIAPSKPPLPRRYPTNSMRTYWGEGFDLINTIRAYRARYHLFTGNYQAALEDADAVDPAATSVYMYDAENENPLYTQVVVADDYAPRDHFGLSSTESGDARLAFYTAPSERTSNPNGFPIEDLAGFWHSATSPIPAYLPGEMALTRAEAHAMLGNIDAAIAEIDAVRTKTPADDPYGVGASLPPYSGPQSAAPVLDEIFRQRRAELFLHGTGWEDSRRLGQPGPSADMFERNRDFYPYADQERLNNSNTPGRSGSIKESLRGDELADSAFNGYSYVFGGSHPTGRVAHVLQARLSLLFSEFPENLLDVVAALSGKFVSYCANFSYDRVIFHRRCPSINSPRNTFITSSPK